MKRVDVEEWAFRVLDRVRSRQPTEDSLVELKSTWPADVTSHVSLVRMRMRREGSP